MVCDRMCLMRCWFLVPSPVIRLSSLAHESPREGTYDNWVPFGGSVLGQRRGVQRKLSLRLLFSKCPRLKTINTPKRHRSEGLVLNRSRVLRRHILSPFTCDLISTSGFLTWLDLEPAFISVMVHCYLSSVQKEKSALLKIKIKAPNLAMR